MSLRKRNKLLIEYRKLLIKNVKLDNKLKRRQIMLNTIDLWKFPQLEKMVEEKFESENKKLGKIHI